MISWAADVVAALKAAVARPSQQVIVNGSDVSADVQSVEITRTLRRGVPPEVSYTQGVVAATGTIKVGGVPARLWHPLAIGGTAPDGQSVTIDLGVDPLNGGAPVRARQLTGVVDRSRAAGLTGKPAMSQLEVIDFTDTLHAAVTIPPAGPQVFARTVPAHAANDGSAAIVHALHRCGIRVTPAPRTEAVWSSPMVGGCIPEIGNVKPWASNGTYDPQATTAPSLFQAGRFGPVWQALTRADITGYPRRFNGAGFQSFFPTIFGAQAQWMIEGWVDLGASQTLPGGATANNLSTFRINSLDNSHSFEFLIDGNGIGRALVTSAGVTRTGAITPVGTGWQYFGVLLLWETTGAIQVYFNYGGTSGFYNYATLTRPAGQQPVIQVLSARPVQGVSFSFGGGLLSSGSPVWPSPLVPSPGADIDILGSRLWSVPPVTDVDALEVIRNVTDAHGATADWTEAGRFRVRSWATMKALPSAALDTLSVEDDLISDGDWSTSRAAVRDELRATVQQPRWELDPVGSGVAIATAEWRSVIVATPGTSIHKLTTDDPVAVQTGQLVPWAAKGEAEARSGLVMCATAQGGTIVTGWGEAILTQESQNDLTLTITNNSGSTIYAAWPITWGPLTRPERAAGDPSVLLYGHTARKPYELFGGISSTSSPRNSLPLRDDPWRQDPVWTAGYLTDLLNELSLQRPTSTTLVTRADPRRQIGDVFRLSSRSGLCPNLLVRVLGIKRSLTRNGGYVDRLTVTAWKE